MKIVVLDVIGLYDDEPSYDWIAQGFKEYAPGDAELEILFLRRDQAGFAPGLSTTVESVHEVSPDVVIVTYIYDCLSANMTLYHTLEALGHKVVFHNRHDGIFLDEKLRILLEESRR